MACGRAAGVDMVSTTLSSYFLSDPIDACLILAAAVGVVILSKQKGPHTSWLSIRRPAPNMSKEFFINSLKAESQREVGADDAAKDKYNGVCSAIRAQNLQRGFDAMSIERGIDKFLAESFPTCEDEDRAQTFARNIQHAISSRCGFVIVEAYPCSKLDGGDDVHVPEIIVNVTVDLRKLVHQPCHAVHGPKKQGRALSLQASLKRMALRVLAQHLIFAGIVDRYSRKFSAEEPRVRMHLGHGDNPLSVVLFINNSVPSNISALLIEIGCQCDGGAKLAYFVSTWARDRGVAYESKGHLGRYAWNVLVSMWVETLSPETMRASPTVWGLFRQFVNYYCKGSEGGRLFEAQIARDGTPHIPDPFSSSTNLGVTMNLEGSQRFFEEFSRARRLLDDPNSTLAQLLEHWTPAAAQQQRKIEGELNHSW
eukprot:TRINITY_DN4499_c0_g6_i1.p1 TRINITY_DN4499_c0_g6~~TRINITY_DN4499_c0_g6_i1.p1  ORF type:complete len:425 (+),score=44.89 TRINITY_DN4499_c0_g6_i1:21-1295(+)